MCPSRPAIWAGLRAFELPIQEGPIPVEGMTFQPGDVGLAHGSGLVDWAIRFAETRRYGKKSQEARWNHAFMITDAGGGLIEAAGRGMQRDTMEKEYAHGDFIVLRPSYPSGGADRAVATMTTLFNDKEKYGYLEIASEALAFLTQTKLRFGSAGQQICSGAVSSALDQGGIPMGEDEEWNSPADVMHIAVQQEWQWVAGAHWA